MRETFLPFFRAHIEQSELAKVAEVLESGWLTSGAVVGALEQDAQRYLNVPYCLAVNSCTAAMHISLLAKGIGSGDSVITTPLTFCSTVNVIEHVGASPVLVDVEVASGNILPDKIVEALTPSVRAIMPVHFGGLPCDLNALRLLAERHNLYILEDCAHAIGAEYVDKKIGVDSEAAAFSFYVTKNMTTAEGGLLASFDEEFIERCRVLSLHGMSKDAWKRYEQSGSWQYDVVAPGFKYNMPDVLAAIGIEQLKKLDIMNDRRKKIAQKYNIYFDSFDFLMPFQRQVTQGTVHSHHLFPVVLQLDSLTISRDRFVEELRKRQIGTSVHFIPIHFHSYYRDKYGWKKGDFPNTEFLYERMISLPIYPSMSDSDVEDVVAAVSEIGREYKR